MLPITHTWTRATALSDRQFMRLVTATLAMPRAAAEDRQSPYQCTSGRTARLDLNPTLTLPPSFSRRRKRSQQTTGSRISRDNSVAPDSAGPNGVAHVSYSRHRSYAGKTVGLLLNESP
ncbi:hypothetical protein BGW80DRAFT_67052 [Lactifluus volemus]|nr:hypothetical protein BGW80DRAFT_67052 [Lactifluus volemus]